MSKLEELIQKLCPNGVEYKTLGEVCSVITKQTGFDYTNHIKASLLIEPTSTSIPYIQTKFFSKKEKKCLHFVRKYYILTKSVAGNNRNQEQTTQMNMASWSRG